MLQGRTVTLFFVMAACTFSRTNGQRLPKKLFRSTAIYSTDIYKLTYTGAVRLVPYTMMLTLFVFDRFVGPPFQIL